MKMSKWNVLGCVVTSVVLGSAAWGESVAVSLVDLGCGPENCAQDDRADMVWHDTSTGEVTLLFMTDTGLDLIESDFTLDGVEITEGAGGQDYQPGTISFSFPGNSSYDNDNSNSSNSNSSAPDNSNDYEGSGASATYEVFGTISDLQVVARGCNHNTTDLAGAFGVTKFDLTAEAINANGTACAATAYVAPYPANLAPSHGLEHYITAFRVNSNGFGDPFDNFTMSINPPPIDAPPGVMRVSLERKPR